MQLPDQPISEQQPNAFRHVDEESESDSERKTVNVA